MLLSQYSIRSKQDYIYKTNRIVEIMGASENITRAWDVLFEQAKKIGLKTCRTNEEFKFANIISNFDNETLDMVELFIGGGNDTVLFRNRECFEKANKAFSFYLLKTYPGMIPMVVCNEVTGNYRDDYSKLMIKSDEEKNRMLPGTDQFILPFSMMDRDTHQPFAELNNGERYSRESLSKRIVGIECRNNDKAIKLIDEMATKRGEESLLAVVHADGNNMGYKIMELLEDNTDYDYCVNSMRSFSKETANAFVDAGLQALEECRNGLINKYKDKKAYTNSNGKIKEGLFAYRKVIADGDDMTFICNARFVMDYTKAYIDAVQNYSKKKQIKWKYSSCAGICIFHSHYSFAKAYQLAEQACDDGAKSSVHIIGEDGKAKQIEEGWVDYHYIHNGMGGNLDLIRENQGTASKLARPWCLTENDKTYSYNKLEKLAVILRDNNVTRTDIKTLGMDWEDSKETGYISLKRVFGHHKGLNDEIRSKLKWDEESLMKAIYDLSEIYDLWFAEV